MKSDTVGLFSFVLLMIPPMIFAGQAAAKDICLTGGGGYILVFKKVESLQPATAIPLTALAFLEGKGGVFPCVGGAAMNADGSAIQAGIFCHDRAGGIHPPEAIRKILDCLGHLSRPPDPSPRGSAPTCGRRRCRQSASPCSKAGPSRTGYFH